MSDVIGLPVTKAVVTRYGSGAGNYSTTSVTFVDVDSANLVYDTVVPSGRVMLISCAADSIVTGGNDGRFGLFDGSASLVECLETQVVGRITRPLMYAFVGDGASHSFRYRFLATAGTHTVSNSSTVLRPYMIFWLV